ncbi:MAG: MFS transporter, partial [Coriobacteriales bacterium]|nr:MFS transporter [Coriobacteriales bacterium]
MALSTTGNQRERATDLQDKLQDNKPGGARFQSPVKIGLVLLFAATAIAIVQYKIPTIMIPLMGIFSIDASLASWLMSVFLLVGVFVALPVGGLAERFGFKRMILAALLLALVGAALGIVSGFIGNAALLIASRAIEGIAFTTITACGPIGVNQCVRPERIGTAMGLFGNWGTCGSAISSFLVPTIFAALGFEWVWLVVAGITILAGVLLLVLVKDPKLEEEKGALAPRAPAPSPHAPTSPSSASAPSSSAPTPPSSASAPSSSAPTPP